MRFILFFLLISGTVFSQRVITGKVIDKESSTLLSGVLVRDTKSENWTISDKEGRFQITILYNEDIELNFSLLGKIETTVSLKNNQNDIAVSLEDNTLRLKEVVVTANKQRQYSELTLGKNAINDVQAFSLDDVLQQLPGQTTTTFNLNEFKNIVFRTASAIANTNKAFGTSFVMNDIPISNNENMQALNPNVGGSGPSDFGVSDKIFNNPNAGVDLREISTNNIEEIKVIQGIPSAKYGDLTSGLVLITSKVGKSPYRVSASIRDATTELNITKGLKFNENNAMNVGLNYLDSQADPRENLLNYKRVNANLSWQIKNSSSKIKNTLSISLRSNLDDAKYDPDDITASVVKNEKKGITLSDNFMWKPNDLWIDGINLNSSFSYEKQLSTKDKWVNSSASSATATTEEGIHEAYILPSQYTSTSSVEGIPISTFISLETTKTITNKANWVHSFVFGLSSRSSSNKGAGRKSGVSGLIGFYTLSREGDNQLGYRDFDFNRTKTESQISAYLEDRIYKKFEDNQVLNVDLGVRYDNQAGYSSLQPRINSSFSLNKTVRLRGGLGLATKSPSLNQIYTGDRYIDRLIGDGIYTYPGIYQKAWIQTIITSGDNLNLKPSKAYRTEGGLDITLPFAMMNVTAYYNKLFDGFSSQQVPVHKVIPKAVVNVNGTEIPTYTLNGTENFYYLTNSITNNMTSEDMGIEAIINFEKIKALNLDVSMNASYVRSTDLTKATLYKASTNLLSAERYGIFDAKPASNDNFTMSFNFNYHIPKVGLLVSLRSEHILLQKSNSATNKFPNAYLDNELVYHEIPVAERSDIQKYGHIMQDLSEIQYEIPNMLHNFHLRVSKDFQNGFSVSLYASNFLNLKPYYYDEDGVKFLSKTANFTFGTTIRYEF